MCLMAAIVNMSLCLLLPHTLCLNPAAWWTIRSIRTSTDARSITLSAPAAITAHSWREQKTVKLAHLYKIVNELLLKPSTGKVVKTPSYWQLRPSPHRPGEIWKWSLFLWLEIVDTNPSRKLNFSKTFFKSEEFENNGLVFVWMENILKTELSRWCDFPARVS